jgi:hypothetical protein
VSRRLGATHIIMFTTFALTGTRSSHAAADWSEWLEAGANAAYVTNPQMLAGSHVTDYVAMVSVDGSTSMQTERTQLTLTPRITLTRYLHETDLNIDAGNLDVAAQEQYERALWTFTGQGVTDSTVTSELGTTGITNVNQRHSAFTLGTNYQYNSSERLSWMVGVAYQKTHYSEGERYGLTDYSYGSIDLGPTWNFTERVQGSIELQADRISPENGARQEDFSASLKLQRAFSERYIWHLTVGGTQVRTDGVVSNVGGTEVQSPTVTSGTSLLLDAGASRQGEQVRWDFSVKRGVRPVGVGLLAEQDEAVLDVLAGITEHTKLHFSANVIRTTPVLYLSYVVYNGASWGQASAEWQYQFAEHWMLSVSYLRARARDGGGQQPWADGDRAQLGILWRGGRL